MSHYAQVKNGIVENVIVAEQDYIDTLSDSQDWIQTSYNTRGGQHTLGGTPLRGNYAGIGFTYDAQSDVFYSPKPFDSWTLNTNTWLWEAPIPYPEDGNSYQWDEATTNWILK